MEGKTSEELKKDLYKYVLKSTDELILELKEIRIWKYFF